MNRAELEELIDLLLDGECLESDFLRLEAELHVDPAARQVYYDRMKLDTVLKLESEGMVEERIVRPVFRRKNVPLVAGIAAAVMILMGWSLGRIGNQPRKAPEEEPLAIGFGVLAEEANAVWETETVNRGELLPQGMLRLIEGIAQLELFSGVTVILEGESEFELHSPMEMTVRTGKLRAIVPRPARGFRVKTSSGEVVDLGTEFALDVGESHADLHVLDGEIEWHPAANPVKRLVDGDSMRWEAGGVFRELPASGESFVGLDEIEQQQSRKHAEWLDYSETLRADPRLLAYYPMTQPGDWNRNVRDESGAGRDGGCCPGNPNLRPLGGTEPGSRLWSDGEPGPCRYSRGILRFDSLLLGQDQQPGSLV